MTTKADLRGKATPCRALEVAAAGCHTVMLWGSRGAGKTALIEAFSEVPGIVERDSCACGNTASIVRLCTCPDRMLYRWHRRTRRDAEQVDMVIEVCQTPHHYRADGFNADHYAARVEAAKKFTGPIELADDAARRTHELITRKLSLSIGRDARMMRVARTIANLDASERIKAKHLAEACQYMPGACNGLFGE